MKKLLQNVLRASVLMAAAATFLVGCKKDDENKSIVTFMVKNGTEVVADAAVTFNGVTNSAGNYIFTAINDGSYTYSVVKSGFETKTGNVTISGDKTVEVDLSGAEVATGEVSGNITQNTTWAKSVVMNGWIYVKSGATLTIKEGTLIKGKTGTKASLIIEKGAKIMAIGTASQPIVFTSASAPGQRAAGDWGGIIILGNAKINPSGGVAEIEGGVASEYGGTNDADNSGTLQYVRIEFPGIPFEPNKEINGLTLGGVGSGTTIDHIQVSYSGDDSYEWFGGTVNAKYIVALAGIDDDFDTDYGFSGNVQFAVALRNPNTADAAGDSNGFESDNDGTGSGNAPFTSAKFSNVSFFGPLATKATTYSSYYNSGARIRRNSRLSAYNTVFAGFPYGIFIEGTNTQANATNNELQLKNCVVAGMLNSYKDKSGEAFDEGTIFSTANGDKLFAENSELMLENPFNLTNPNFMPKVGSPLLSGAAFTGLPSFFEQVTFVGAFGTQNWMEGWTNFDPQNTAY